MSATVTIFGWAVLYPVGQGFGPEGAPTIWTVAPSRQSAMERFVADWRHSGHDGLTVSKVWQRAYSRGWRLSRVSITPAFGGPA